MELQQSQVAMATQLLWNNKTLLVDSDNMIGPDRLNKEEVTVPMNTQGGGLLLCQERDENQNVTANKRINIPEEALGGLSMDFSGLLLVWSGQPNEDDDGGGDDEQRRKDHRCSSCTITNDNDDGDQLGPKDQVVGWPPIGSWRKKLLHQQQGLRQAENGARRRGGKKDNGRSNTTSPSYSKITKKKRTRAPF